MQEYTNEHEQWEAIRDWCKKNGLQLVIIFCASLLITFGFRYWQSHQLEKKQEASQLFDQLLSEEKANPDAALIPRIAAELKKDYPRTIYAPLAALFEAKNAVAKNDLPLAEQELLWAIDHSKSSPLRSIATLRLARVLLAHEKPKAALALLEGNTDPNYYPAIEQIKGDIYLTQKKIEKARSAYQNALAALPPSAPLKNYVQMQLNQLPANN
jgi:predicted negative regulator of RcsB-dependent stress response